MESAKQALGTIFIAHAQLHRTEVIWDGRRFTFFRPRRYNTVIRTRPQTELPELQIGVAFVAGIGISSYK